MLAPVARDARYLMAQVADPVAELEVEIEVHLLQRKPRLYRKNLALSEELVTDKKVSVTLADGGSLEGALPAL